MKYLISRIDGKGKKFEITSVYADSYMIEMSFDQCISYSQIHFYTHQSRFARKPIIGQIASLCVSGDVVVEQG